MPRILVIDSLDGDQVRDSLLSHKHTVRIASTVAEGLAAMEMLSPHLIVLDHVLSDGNGLMLMPRFGGVPLIVLSAADDQQTRVMALRSGADDFVSKPWNDTELQERVAAVFRRSYHKMPAIGENIVIGELVIAFGSVLAGGKRLNLTKSEHTILATVAAAAGRVVPRSEILAVIYGKTEVGDWHSVVTHLGRLRRKLVAAGVERAQIRTVAGRGLTMDYVPVDA